MERTKILTVNTAPARARRLIARVIEVLSPKYSLVHVDNCQTIDEVPEKAAFHQPEVLLSASMWNDEEAKRIHTVAEAAVPGVITHAIPFGLQVERGPDAVVEYLIEKLPVLLSRER